MDAVTIGEKVDKVIGIISMKLKKVLIF